MPLIDDMNVGRWGSPKYIRIVMPKKTEMIGIPYPTFSIAHT